MANNKPSREERLGQLRAWARPPHRTIDVVPGVVLQKPPGSGVALLPSAGLRPVRLQPNAEGGASTFHSGCDAPAGTTVSSGPGNVIGWADLLCVFWGSAWTNPSLSPGVGDIFNAVGALSQMNIPTTFGTYNYFENLSDYSGGNFITWGFDVAGPPLIIPTNPPNNPFSLGNVGNEANAIYNTPNLGPDNVYWSLLMIFMPPGYTPSGPQGEHSFFTDPYGAQINYGYVSYASALSTISFIFSHELVESLTDPHGDAWQVNPRNSGSWNEICDACCSSGTVNGVTVTSYYSTSASACVIPSPPGAPLPPGDYQIDKVRKVAGGRYIQSVSGPGNGQGRWELPEYDVVTMIQEGLATFYTLEGGRRANVEVVQWWLQTVSDDFVPNNLDALPEF